MEVALQLDGITCSEQDQRQQPQRRRLGDMRAADLAERAADIGRAVQNEPPAHPNGRAGVDFVHERRAEEVGAVDRGHEAVVRGVEYPLLVAEGRLNSRGLGVASRSKTGRGRTTVPIFLLVPQVKLPKRLDLERDTERAHYSVPGLIVANWLEVR